MKSAIVLCLIAGICNGTHFQGPSNTTVPEGARATLYCQTSVSKTVWWKYFKHDVFYANAISYDYKSSHEAEMDVSRGIYNLIIRNASTHPGLYTCVDNDGEGESRSAWLTVAPEETDPENNTLYTVLIAVGTAIFAIGLIVTLLAICCNRLCKRCRDTGAAVNLDQQRATDTTKEESNPLMNKRPSKDVRLPNEDKDDVSADAIAGDAFIFSSLTMNPLAKPGMPPAEPEDLSASAPVEKDETENDDVNTTERESTIKSTYRPMTDNMQADRLKPGRLKDGRPTPPPKPNRKIEESIVKPTKTIVSQEEQGTSEIPKPKPETTTRDSANERKNTKENDKIMPTLSPEQGKDSSPKLHEGASHSKETEERCVTKQLMTEGDDKEEISFENEQHVGQMGGEAG